MRARLFLLIFAALCGCVETGCLSCDDGNPCTNDACVEGKCSYKPLTGPMEGCSGSGGCIEYGCFSGECIPQKIVQCCGNGACDGEETWMDCPRDCLPTCIDGVRNQGETGVDCGGPCNACESAELNYIRKIGHIRGAWYESAANYTESIRIYNADQDRKRLMSAAMRAYGDTETERDLVTKSEAPPDHARLKSLMNATASLYMLALHNMALYVQTADDSRRLASNRYLADAFDNDRIFVREYNLKVDESNRIQTMCLNYVKDPEEESVDCGGACSVPCDVVINVTKHVILRNEGGSARIIVNISSPTMDYPPVQTLLGYHVDPIPDGKDVTPEGNIYYTYVVDAPPYGVREFTVTQTIRLYKVPYPAKADTAYFNSLYLVENNWSRTTDDICYRAKRIKEESGNISDNAADILDWMIGNVQYELNHEELGAEYCYINRRGACDEHADLFVSMARCDGIPARRITGSLMNASQLNGHAWAEYYDGGWIYLDPSVKKKAQAFIPDNRHIAACVGEGAYHCGVGYAYTYTGKKPKITVEERVYLS